MEGISELISSCTSLMPLFDLRSHNQCFSSMHLVTSSIFIPSIAAYLSPRSQVLLLRSYFRVCLGWCVVSEDDRAGN